MIATKLQLANAPSTQEQDIMEDSCKSMHVGGGQHLVICKNNEVLQKLANNVEMLLLTPNDMDCYVNCIHIQSLHMFELF